VVTAPPDDAGSRGDDVHTEPGVDFEIQVSQNKYRSPTDTGMAAVLTVTSHGHDAAASVAAPVDAAVVILVDCSGSMAYPPLKMSAAQKATAAAIEAVRDGTRFAIVAGTDTARMVYPLTMEMAVADPETRHAATRAVHHLFASGGTAMGTWLALADTLLERHPGLVRHAILLTDGINQHETAATLEQVLATCQGHFVCDARGIGEDWDHHQLLRITQVLRGSAEAIGHPGDLVADFQAVIGRTMHRQVPTLRVRVWTVPGVRVRALRQETPTLTDLTEHARTVDERTTEFDTGSWAGEEDREFLLDLAIAFRVDDTPADIGEDLLAARVDLVVDGARRGDPRPVVVHWTDDLVASTRIDAGVARATGQEALSAAIADGCDALLDGDLPTATDHFQSAHDMARTLGATEILRRLDGLVDVGGDGRVRVRGGWNRSALLRVAVSSVMFPGDDGHDDGGVDQAPGTPAAGPDLRCPGCERLWPPGTPACEACRQPLVPVIGPDDADD
jgi:hypothetical protein